MNYKSLLLGSVLVCVVGILPVLSSSATAASPAPSIDSFSPTQGTIGATVTIEGTNLADATKVTFGQIVAKLTEDSSSEIDALVPPGATTGVIKVTTPDGSAKTRGKFVVRSPLAGVLSLASDENSSCALLTTGRVDCWGDNSNGQLGDGRFKTSAVPVAVLGTGGTGTLSNVTSLTGDLANGGTYCALLSSGGVDCWGDGYNGQLGDGTFKSNSAVPVPVLGVGGTGTLSSVRSVTSDVGGSYGENSYCVILNSGGVDCWGDGFYGQLGDGDFYYTGGQGSAVPVAVLGVNGNGTLGGVASIASIQDDYCAVLTSGGVDCWGSDFSDQLGDGLPDEDSAVPVAVIGVNGTGTLEGVANIVSSGSGATYCALLSSGGVDCWGEGDNGQLGNGVDCCGVIRSPVPVTVLGLGGSGTLTGVVSIVSDGGKDSTYCALLASRGVACWGSDRAGQLGNGVFYNHGSPQSFAPPMAVLGVGGTGSLSGVTNLVSDQTGFCSLLTSGSVDCWGEGNDGQLGDGVFYTTGGHGSAVPVVVLGGGGAGSLSEVQSLASDQTGFCSLLTTDNVDCWGQGNEGQLGNGVDYTVGNEGSAIPVVVLGEKVVRAATP